MDGVAKAGEVVSRYCRLRLDIQLSCPVRRQRIDGGNGGSPRIISALWDCSQSWAALSSSDSGSGPVPVIILGYDLWQRTFNGDPHIIGKTVRMSRRDTPPTVVGVMPPGVRFLPSPGVVQEPNYNVNAPVDFWVPAAPNPARLKQPGWDVVGRLRHAATINQAQEELTVIAARQAQAEHDFEGIAPTVQSLTAELNRDGRRILLPLLGAAALVLILSSPAERRGAAAGARASTPAGVCRAQRPGVGRVALFRQVSTESLLLALFGGALGRAWRLAWSRSSSWLADTPSRAWTPLPPVGPCWPGDWVPPSWPQF